MSAWKRFVVVGVLLASALGAFSVIQAHGPRQYYGNWNQNKTYYYRSYYYKPRANYSSYKHHYTIYYPTRPKHYYFYNPYKKQMWGRCPSSGYYEEPTYSLLQEEHRKPLLSQIQESHFPAPGPLPFIPESADNTPIDLPPDDLPDNAQAAIGAGLPAVE